MARGHHYVSQVYLRRFAASPGKVWVYDKEEDRIYPGPTSTENVAQEGGFYALPDDPRYPDDDPEIIEDQLAAFEDDFVKSMDVAVRIADEGGTGSLNERIDLAKTVAFQHLRTRAARDKMAASYQTAGEHLLDAVLDMAYELSGRERPAVKVTIEFEDKRAWALQADAMWGDGVINELALRIYNSVWLIALNHSTRPFITSDTPVVSEEVARVVYTPPPQKHPIERLVEVKGPAVPAAPGTQTFIPLTPRHALIILNPATFPESIPHQGKVLNVGRATVDQINAAQVAYSRRWVYASTADFSQAVPESDYASRSRMERRLALPS